MKEIDWSKAPEGATHHLRDNSGFVQDSFVFEMEDRYKEVGTSGYLMKKDLKGSWALTPRPQAWNGEGLPPVGTKVEFFNNQEWVIVEILFLTDITILIRLIDEFGRQECALHPDHCKFRPIATPEQIAAEEREAAIQQMCEDAGKPDMPLRAREQAGMLYDAGWRKQEQPK